MRDNKLDVRIQWSSDDQCWAAVLLRDGEEWYLNGALVGMGSTRGRAVMDLITTAKHLVVLGENALTEKPLSLEDRVWLFEKLDYGPYSDEDMYRAMKKAGYQG